MIAPQKYTKRPVTIEAVQVRGLQLGEIITYFVDQSIMLANWCGGVSHMMTSEYEKAYTDAPVIGPHIMIPTLEGSMAARPGDYIIKGVAGEFYPCRADIFAATYDVPEQT